MVSTRQVLAAAALLSLGAAAPTAIPNEGVSFSIRQVANPNYAPEDHATLYRRALEKANPSLRKRATAGSATANTQFQVPIKVGSQTFQLTFDTGSSDLWLIGDALNGQGNHTYYKPGSTAKQVNGASFKIAYADGSNANGDVYTDNVSVGSVSVTGMEVGHATTASSAFIDGDTDGLLGLGPGIPSIQPGPAKTFMETFAAQGGQSFFAVDLQKDAPGTYDFGMMDKSKYSGDIAYTPANLKSGYWEITTDDNIKAIVDTGTTVTVLPKDAADKYWAQVESAKSSVPAGHGTETIWDFDCTETLPNYNLMVDGKTIKVPGSVINMGDSGNGRCTGGLQVNTDFSQFSIIGDMFIQGMYVVYDLDGSRVGFAAKAGSGAAATGAASTTAKNSPSAAATTTCSETAVASSKTTATPVAQTQEDVKVITVVEVVTMASS